MVTLSSAFGVVMVGFFALFRRMTHAFVVVTWLVDEGTLDVIAPCVTKKPSTLRKLNALPLWPEPPSQAPRRIARPSTVTTWRSPASRGSWIDSRRVHDSAHGFAGSVSGRRMFG